MTRSELADAIEHRGRAADHASDALQNIIARFNDLNDVAVKRMRDMVFEQRKSRGKDEYDRR